MKSLRAIFKCNGGAAIAGAMLVAPLFCGLLSAAPAEPQGSIPHQIVVKHPGIYENKPQSYTLSQTLDERGHPVGYFMEVDSVVCTDGLCKVVTVTMEWDALGDYRSYSVADGSVLEKALIPDENETPKKKAKDNTSSERDQAWTAFTDEDHAKLHHILSDRSSILKDQQLSDLTSYRDKSRVDAMSGATPLTVRESVVQGAALSSYHLWHWANGEVVALARELTHQNCSEEMLLEFLASDESRYNLFALEHLQQSQLFTPAIVSAVIDVMSRGKTDQIDYGLAYLRLVNPDQDALYANLSRLFEAGSSDTRIHLLGLLEPELSMSAAKLDKLSVGLAKTDSYYELHLFLGLAEQHEQVSEQLLTRASRFLESENFFMARRAYWFLEKQTLNEQLTRQIEAFRNKCENENRSLG